MTKATLTLLFVLMASPVLASTLDWSRNQESDMASYRIYRCATANPCVKASATLQATIPQTATGVSPSWPVPASIVTGFGMVTAVDQAGNESGPSNTINFDLAPSAPASLTITP